MKVVFDTGVVLSSAGLRHEAYACLVLVARRRVFPYATADTLDELLRIARRMQAEGAFPQDPRPILDWYRRSVRLVEPVPLGKPRSRDPKDAPFHGCAVAAHATLYRFQGWRPIGPPKALRD